ncbi:MAG: mechanosensitive ion channel family protein, partial [Anaerolineales bacterium]
TVAAIYWLYVFLRSINLNRRVLEGIKNIITHEISIGSANFTIGEIFVFILVIWISVILSRFLQIVLEKDVLNRFKLAKGIPYTVGLMVRYAIITAGIFLAVSAAGLSVTNLGILIGALGVGIGFGLQNIFNNLVSGLILLFERPIQIGDTVEVGSLIGKVKSIGIRSSNVRTFEGAEVIVPNGQFISNEVVNWTLSDQNRRIEVIAGVAYGSDPHKVQKLLFEAIKKHPDVIDEPPPEVFFNGLGESSLDFRILFWTANINEWLRIRSEIVFMVHDVLKENGIEIPFPQRDLHIKSIIPGSTIIQNSATLGHRQDQK